MRVVRLAVLLACLVIVMAETACEHEATVAPKAEPAASARAESPLGWLQISLPAIDMRTVDTLDVQITLDREPGVVAGELAFDPAESGWTVGSAGAPLTSRSADGGLRTAWNYALQPFLDGSYTIPPAEVVLNRTGAEPVRLSTPEQGVTVSSVLAANEEPQLAGPLPLLEPEAATDVRPYWFAGAVTAIVVLIVAAVLVTRRLGRTEAVTDDPMEAPDAHARARALQDRLTARLITVCNAPMMVPTTEQLNAHIDRCPWIRDRESLGRLLVRLEEAVYGPAMPNEAELTDLEARTTRMLAAIDPSTPGGEVA